MTKKSPGHFIGRKCEICGSDETYIDCYGRRSWSYNKDKDGNWTGGYLCNKCFNKYDPDSYDNIRKHMRKVRTGCIEKGSNQYKSIISEATVCKVLGIENLNIKNDNFEYYIDASHDKYGHIDIKACSPDDHDEWNFYTKRKIDCDTYFCLGMDYKWKNVETVLIVPNEDWLIDISGITISRYPKHSSRYDIFKVDNSQYNEAYHDLLLYLKDAKSFGVDDIKKWSNKNV